MMIIKRCFILLAFFLIIENQAQSEFKEEIRHHIYASLIINYYELKRDGFEIGMSNSLDEYASPMLDSNCYYLYDTTKLNRTFEYRGQEFDLFKYKFEFRYFCDGMNWAIDETMDSLLMKSFGNPIGIVQNNYDSITFEIRMLHRNGLYGLSKDSREIVFISGNSLCELIDQFFLDTLENDKIDKLINLKYYNYSPNEINIDTSYNRFSFYSKTLKRYVNGVIMFNQSQKYYFLKLENGTMVGM